MSQMQINLFDEQSFNFVPETKQRAVVIWEEKKINPFTLCFQNDTFIRSSPLIKIEAVKDFQDKLRCYGGYCGWMRIKILKTEQDYFDYFFDPQTMNNEL